MFRCTFIPRGDWDGRTSFETDTPEGKYLTAFRPHPEFYLGVVGDASGTYVIERM